MPELLRRSSDGGGLKRRKQKKHYVLIILLSAISFWFTALIRVSNRMPTGEASYQLSDLDVYDIDESDFVESSSKSGSGTSVYDDVEENEDDEDWRVSVEEKAEEKAESTHHSHSHSHTSAQSRNHLLVRHGKNQKKSSSERATGRRRRAKRHNATTANTKHAVLSIQVGVGVMH